jgi:hypothetical protein
MSGWASLRDGLRPAFVAPPAMPADPREGKVADNIARIGRREFKTALDAFQDCLENVKNKLNLKGQEPDAFKQLVESALASVVRKANTALAHCVEGPLVVQRQADHSQAALDVCANLRAVRENPKQHSPEHAHAFLGLIDYVAAGAVSVDNKSSISARSRLTGSTDKGTKRRRQQDICRADF